MTYLGKGGVGEAFKVEQGLLSSLEDAGGGDGGHAHAVAQEQDDVGGAVIDGTEALHAIDLRLPHPHPRLCRCNIGQQGERGVGGGGTMGLFGVSVDWLVGVGTVLDW